MQCFGAGERGGLAPVPEVDVVHSSKHQDMTRGMEGQGGYHLTCAGVVENLTPSTLDKQDTMLVLY